MKNYLTRKVGFEGTQKLCPVLEVTTSYIKLNMESKLELNLENNDISHSWVRISHDLNKLVTDLIDKEYDDNEQETSEMKSEEFALKTNVLPFASRSNSEAKSRKTHFRLLIHKNCTFL